MAGAAHPGDVANMSLGGGAYEPIDLAVINMAAAGYPALPWLLVIGNDNANNHSPARANGVKHLYNFLPVIAKMSGLTSQITVILRLTIAPQE